MTTPQRMFSALLLILTACLFAPSKAMAQDPSMTIVLTPNSKSARRSETVTFSGTLTFSTGATPAKIVSGTVIPTIPALMNGEYIGPPAGVIIGSGGAGAVVTGNLFRVTPHGGPAGTRTGTLQINWSDKNGDSHLSSAGFSVNVTPAPPALLVMLIGGLGTGFAARRTKRKAATEDK